MKATRTRDRPRPVLTGTTLQTTLLRDRLYFALESISLSKTNILRGDADLGKGTPEAVPFQKAVSDARAMLWAATLPR